MTPRGWRGRRMGNDNLVGIEFWFYKTKGVMEMDVRDGFTVLRISSIPLHYTLKNS